MPNFGKLDKDLFCKTLHVKGDLVIDCKGDIQHIGNITIDYDATFGRNLTVLGNSVVSGFMSTRVNDKTGSALYTKMKNTSVSIYNNAKEEFFSGFFVSPDGWVVTAAHGLLTGNVSTKTNVGNVFVTVSGINGNVNTNITLQSESIYVDAAGDLAVIKLPGIISQPYLEWGNSLSDAPPGSRCYTIGNPLASDHQSIENGLIRDNEFVKFPAPLESILTSISSYSGQSGSPIVNEYGKVIGVLTFGVQGDANADVSTLTGGPSQRVAEHIVSTMINDLDDYTIKGYLGTEFWYPVNAYDIVTLGLIGSGFNTRGIVLGNVIAGEALDNANLTVNDIITKIDNYVVGDLDNQTHLSTATWFKTAGETVDIEYIRPPSISVYSTIATLGLYPVSADEPLIGNFSGTGDATMFSLPGTRIRRHPRK
jgi:S1-C subfamily serine protease